jgi:hypothetical protein
MDLVDSFPKQTLGSLCVSDPNDISGLTAMITFQLNVLDCWRSENPI